MSRSFCKTQSSCNSAANFDGFFTCNNNGIISSTIIVVLLLLCLVLVILGEALI